MASNLRVILEKNYAPHLGNSPKGDWFMNNIIETSIKAAKTLEGLLPGFDCYVELDPGTLDRKPSNWQVDADKNARLTISGTITLSKDAEYATGSIMIDDEILVHLEGWSGWKTITGLVDVADNFTLA